MHHVCIFQILDDASSCFDPTFFVSNCLGIPTVYTEVKKKMNREYLNMIIKILVHLDCIEYVTCLYVEEHK